MVRLLLFLLGSFAASRQLPGDAPWHRPSGPDDQQEPGALRTDPSRPPDGGGWPTQPGCCGHSVAAYTASASESFIFDPNAAGTGISVFKATP